MTWITIVLYVAGMLLTWAHFDPPPARRRGWYRVGQAGALLLWPLLALGGAAWALALRAATWIEERTP